MKTTVTLAKSFALMAMFAIINLNFNLTYSQIFHQKQANQIVPGSKKVFKDAQKGTIKYIEFDQRKRMINQADEALLSTSLNLSPLYHFKVKNEHRDQKGILHQKYQLHYKNIPVEGFVYHLHKENGLVSSANGEYFIADDIDTEPSISESAAFTKAINFSNAESYIWEGDESLRTRGELVILPKNDKFYLAYKFDIWSIAPTSRKWIFVDAHLGEILNTIDRIHIVDSVGTAVTKYNGTRNITTDYTGTNYRLRESGRRVETYDLNNSTNYSSAVDFTDSDNYWDVIANQDNAAYDAHFGTEMTYDFYFHRFGRNSYDNAGSTLKSYVHYSTNYANAFWNGSFMTYGDGDGVTFSALTSLDIVAHEITHAVTEYSAGLIYSYESGALNESFSDIFGISVDFYANPTTANYYCGDQVHLTGNGIRNMANPNEFGDPDTYLGTYWYTGSGDNGGVHTNNGVQNFWFYLLCEGGSGTNDIGNAYNVTAIGIDHAAEIAYRTLTVYLTPSSNFADARFYSIQSALDLYGECSQEVISVTNAWQAVGVGDAFEDQVTADFRSDTTYFCSSPADIRFINLSQNASAYYWEFGDGTTSTDENPVHTFDSTGIYSVTLIASGSGACSSSDTIFRQDYITITNVGPPAPASCYPVTLNPGSSGIYYFMFGGLTNYTGNNNSDGYEEYTCTKQAEITEGREYSLLVLTNTVENVWVWIDFNNDAILDNSSEMIYSSPNSGDSHFKFITVPQGSVYDVPLRLRVVSDVTSNAAMNPCGPIEYGQCEDYTVIIRQNFEKPEAAFETMPKTLLAGNTVTFTDKSKNLPVSWEWYFEGGDPVTSDLQNPTVRYDSLGSFDVRLIVINSYGSDTLLYPDHINVVEYFNICTDSVTGSLTGIIYDSGGPEGNYSDNENCSFLINIPCADSILIAIDSLNTEPGSDILNIYDGNNEYCPLLMSLSGTAIPGSPLVAASGSVFLTFSSNSSLNNAGFKVTWSVKLRPAPITNFEISDTIPIYNTETEFRDISANYPTSWLWDFGDGNHSTEQNPVHFYITQGKKSIKLITANCFGEDSFIRNISVQEPPSISVSVDSFSVNLFTGDTLVQSLEIDNSAGNGDALIDFEIQEIGSLYSPSRDKSNDIIRTDLSEEEYCYSCNQSTENKNVNSAIQALPYRDGFESGNFDNWINNSGTGIKTVTNTIAAKGLYSFYYNNTSTSGHVHGIQQEFNADAQPKYISFHIRSGSTTQSDAYFVLMSNYSTLIWFYANSAGRFYINEDVGGNQNFAYNADQWYHIEFKNIDWVNKDFDYYVDEVLIQADIPFRNASVVNSTNQLFLYNYTLNSEAWWDEIIVSDKPVTNWLTVGAEIDTVQAGTAGNCNVKFNAENLFGGEYSANIILRSNDPVNQEITIPAHLHVTGSPVIELSDDTLDLGTTFTNVSVTDTIVISNTGTDILYIDSIRSPNSKFSLQFSDSVVGIQENSLLIMEYSSALSGRDTAVINIYSNDRNNPVSKALIFGETVLPPVISISPDSYEVNLFAGDTLTEYLTITNTGGCNLDWHAKIAETSTIETPLYKDYQHLLSYSFDENNSNNPGTGVIAPIPLDIINQLSGTVRILAWVTYADIAQEYTNTLNAISQYFTDFTVTITTSSDPVILANELSDKDILLIPEQEMGTQSEFISLGIAWSGVLNNFIKSGGSIILCGSSTGAHEIINSSGLMPISLYSFTSSGAMNVDTTHFITQNLPTSISAMNATAIYNLNDPLAINLVTFNGYTSIAAKEIGTGKIAIVGYDFYSYDNNASKIISNAVKWCGLGPNWVEISSESGTIPTDSSFQLEIKFNAAELDGGSYLSNINILSNDPVNPQIVAPVTMHVTGAPDIELSSNAVDLGVTFINRLLFDTVFLSNAGTDILQIEQITNTNNHFSIAVSDTVIPADSTALLFISYSSSTAQKDSSVISIYSNDPHDSVVNITLHAESLLPPVISISPDSFDVELISGDTTVHYLTISNNSEGGGNLDFEISVRMNSDYNYISGLDSFPSLLTDDLDQYHDYSISKSSQNFPFSSNGMAINAASSGRLFAVSLSGGNILEIDPVNGFILDTIYTPVSPPWGPEGLAFDGNYLYYSDSYGIITRIDINAKQVVDQINLGLVSYIDGLGTSDDYLYILNYYQSILKVNYKTSSIIDTVITGNIICALTYAKDRNSVFCVTNDGNYSIIEIDLKAYQIINTFPLGYLTYGLSYSNSLDLLFVADHGSGYIRALNPDNGNIQYSFPGSASALAGDESGNSSWIIPALYSGSVAPGNSIDIPINFNAINLNADRYNADLIITCNDPVSPTINIPLSMNVLGSPNIEIFPDTLSFETYVGSESYNAFIISNIGTDTLKIADIISDNSAFIIDTTSFEIAPGGEVSAYVKFRPSAAGIITGNLTITSNDLDNPSLSIALVGNAVSPPAMMVSPELFDIDLAPDDSITEYVLIRNTGGSDLIWNMSINTNDSLTTNIIPAFSQISGTNNNNEVISNAVVGEYQNAIGDFTLKAPSPVALTCVTFDPQTNLIYAQQNNGYQFYRYDPSANIWTSLTNCPINSGNNGGATVINGHIYTCYTNSNMMGIYSISEGTWSTFSAPVSTANITNDGYYIYLANGTLFYRIDSNSLTSTILTSSPISFQPWGGLVCYNGFIYGHSGNGSSLFARYNISTNTWITLAPIPGGAVLGCAIDPINKKYYTYGSYSGNNWYEFDLETESWSVSTIPFFTVEDGGMCFVKDGIYFVQGEAGTGFGFYETSSWINTEITTGIVPPGGIASIPIKFNSKGLEIGEYTAVIDFHGNDPVLPTKSIPVKLNVLYKGPCIDETFTALSGSLSDNSGPEEYANERDCHKLIQPAGAANITLTFTSFSTEENYDFVTVYDGATTSAPELGRFSGSSLPPVITSSGGSMLVRFTSDGSVTAQGWEAQYTSVEIGQCTDETFTAMTGTVDDNSEVLDYKNNADCYKLIQPASADSIFLTFTAFSTEAGNDVVTIYDGSTTSAPVIGSYTGSILPPVIVAYSGSMLIRFTTNASVIAAGWSADYVAIGSYQGPCIDETFTTLAGSLSDNSGPEEYANERDCHKLIQPAGAANITLTFTSFSTEENYDFVTVYDGATTSAPELGRFSGSSLPPVITSSGGSMLVRFTSDGSVTAQGWEAQYTSVEIGQCTDETFTAMTGTVDDNSAALDYKNNADCYKLIQPASADSIFLTFTAFSTEAGNDVVTIYDGSTTSATVIGSYSGSILPPVIAAYSGSMLIRFTTNASVTAAGWSADYAAIGSYQGPCIDETFTTLAGSLSDNSGPEEYANERDCHKLIQPAGAANITLTFSSFSTEDGYDFVTVYDGATTSAPELGRFSGSSLPPALTSSGGSMLVRFTSDGSVTAQGWEAQYTSVEIGQCTDETFTAMTGTVDDNSAALDYKNNADCYKLIQPASADSIFLTFTAFSTEAGNDVVTIYDGSTTSAPVIGSYTGSILPPVIVAYSGSMLIRFTTNASVTAAGWSADYVAIGSYQGPCIDETFTALSGSLSDNSGPEEYSNERDCHKLIQPAGAANITLTFTSFSTEDGYDFVTVYDGATTSAPELGRFSGSSLPPVITSSGGSMLVRFTSDGSVTAQGWEAQYTSVEIGQCTDETFTAMTGTVDDNSAALDYKNNADCYKLIQPASADSIFLTFTSFNTEAVNDVVTIYDGSTTSAPVIGSYSGSTLPPVLTAYSGSMLIRFTTNASVTAAGWSADYEAIGSYQGPCIDETFTTLAGSLSDNSGPEEYANERDCHKLIQPAGAANITLTFSSFSTEDGYDFVTVYDGATTSTPELGRFSGSSMPPVITSSGGSMLVRFTSDGSVTAQGWEAQYTSVEIGQCTDETFTAMTGTVDDNSAALDYKNNADCYKLIQPASADSIFLTFTAFSTEAGNDVVTIYDGSTTSAPVIGSYSGSILPPVIAAYSGSMLIRFTTNASVTAAGWSADYVAIGSYQGPCIDETFTALSGSLSDNSGPEEYANERDCHKLIQPAGAANITLTFTSFSTEENYDFVTVYDGATTSAPELGRFSGSSLPPVITSSGGSMMVRFTSDGSVTAQGWEALYESSQSYEIISEKSSRADKIKRYPNYDNIIFSLYPNPTKGKIKLICDELTDEDLIIEIINPEGKISRLMQIENYNGFTEIDFSDFTVGVYYVKIYNNDFVKLHKVIYSE